MADSDAMLMTMSVPSDWTVEQAEAVLVFISAFEGAIWEIYEDQLTAKAAREAAMPLEPPDYGHPYDEDDEIPF